MGQSKRIQLILSGLLTVLAIALLLSNKAFPNSSNLYNLKRLQEKSFLALRTTPQAKVEYYNSLLDERLNELTFLVDNRHSSYLLTSSLRYSTTAGRLTELISSYKLTESVDPARNKFLKHQETIQNLIDSYPTNENNGGKFIQDSYNYLSIYLDMLSQISNDEI